MIQSENAATERGLAAALAPLPGDGAYEMKFVLPDELMAPVSDWARAHIPPDSHAAGDELYHIHSVYLDTSAFDVYHRTEGYNESKYRVRRYGRESVLWLENKIKVKGWVRKVRTCIPEAELARLDLPEPDPTWAGDWFWRRMREYDLVPCCEIAYQRLARVGEAEGAPIRLTLDRQIRCAPTGRLELGKLDETEALLVGRNVLELKFRTGLPLLFKDLIREFRLAATPSSKYRRAVDLCGLVNGAAPHEA